ncbi:hypothetical protein CPC08DRAFT_711465 [Agrocybe pediades]|nr:hypothetical protein CPC08DRAFT_711465 [Agrocybe pediades]
MSSDGPTTAYGSGQGREFHVDAECPQIKSSNAHEELNMSALYTHPVTNRGISRVGSQCMMNPVG